ncbi:hypothetical protein AB0B10_25475 [Micromonospora arborensis]|uniref:hypothetical protein n=1 Tax=Micromonospora arborensis TaxID=2116518 RepID=UPI0033EB31CB
MPEPIPPYAEPVMRLRDAAFDLARSLEGDVQVDKPDVLVALLRSAAIALGKSIAELMAAADTAGHGPARDALRRAVLSQTDSAQAMAEAVQALTTPRMLRD